MTNISTKQIVLYKTTYEYMQLQQEQIRQEKTENEKHNKKQIGILPHSFIADYSYIYSKEIREHKN